MHIQEVPEPVIVEMKILLYADEYNALAKLAEHHNRDPHIQLALLIKESLQQFLETDEG